MSRFTDQDHISVYKRRVMNYLNNNRRIVELCEGTYGESQSCVRFFPFEYIPDTIETAFATVCFDIEANYSPVNSTFINMVLYFFIASHMDIAVMKTEPGLRYDIIAHELVKDFANKDFLGIGKAQLAFNEVYAPKSFIRGRTLSFNIFDVSPEAYEKHAESFIRN